MLTYKPQLKKNARILRKDQTVFERLIWGCIRKRRINGIQFYRQRPIGPYIVDFYAPKIRLVIELDGGQHYEIHHEIKDKMRDEYLRAQNLHVLRFSNLDVIQNKEGVLTQIIEACQLSKIPSQY